MDSVQREDGRGVLNETSMTIHKHKIGAADLQTVCGQVYHIEHGQLRIVQVDEATQETDADKCGRCFEEGRG
jgi:hypothetical protein